MGGARAMAVALAHLDIARSVLVVLPHWVDLFSRFDLVAHLCDGCWMARPVRVSCRVLRSVWSYRFTNLFLSPLTPHLSPSHLRCLGLTRVLAQSSVIRIRLESVGLLADLVARSHPARGCDRCVGSLVSYRAGQPGHYELYAPDDVCSEP